ncbi:MAG: YggT family protein [Aquisalimonadaceae bacterium]
MTGNYLGDPLAFLVQTLFGLYILAVMLRFLLQLVRADFYNPITQLLVKVTHPPLAPLRRVLPSIGRADTASIVLMVALQFAALALVLAIAGRPINPAFLLVYSVAELVNLLLNVFLFAVLIRVVISWISPGSYHPGIAVLDSLTEPVVAPARRLIPPMGGLDLSPMVVLIGIQLLKMLLIPPIRQLAFSVG